MAMKRTANVPTLARAELDTLSKADLMEMVWHLAMERVKPLPGVSTEENLYSEVTAAYRRVCAAGGRKPAKLADSMAALARRRLALIAEQFDVDMRIAPEFRTAKMRDEFSRKRAAFETENADFITYLHRTANGEA